MPTFAKAPGAIRTKLLLVSSGASNIEDSSGTGLNSACIASGIISASLHGSEAEEFFGLDRTVP